MTQPIADDATRIALEAAAFRRLVAHLRERSDVQNIDLMTLAGFCRNCLSRWYREAAEEAGLALTDPAAREIIYGMPYKDWQAKHQTPASEAQRAALAKSHPGH
ncbi:DUF1244 domain-containing protein [Acidiphilium sp.]|jgi:hypothetical protein|uniref:DUF1244 domain-containing protein n=1 Tax=Acidiphilium sp. TaxID=527 RepID=UPI00258C2978|nr:DUF1244 domain-containing protein [Acidiphilium sp.]